ncbi:MAG: hypothetical protein IKR85_08140 [Clostridia bacterium]|nr:hypothetical protein [Clostridia bacterium]
MRKIILVSVFAAILFALCVCACADSRISCDTRYNGCAGVPVTWTAKNATNYRIYIYGNDTPIAEGKVKNGTFSYTPAQGGQYFAVCKLKGGDVIVSDEVSVADKLLMGTCEQAGDGGSREPIEWTVLAVEDGRMLVISKYILLNRSYFNPWWIKYKYTYWAYSYIGDFDHNYWGSQPEDPSRKFNVYGHDGILMQDKKTRGSEEDLYNSELHVRYWCNSIFYTEAFTDAERSRILLTHNQNADNPEYGIKGGPDTEDYVFFLSYDEVRKYMPNKADRVSSQTRAARHANSENDSNFWWLRSPGRWRVNAMYVYGNSGSISLFGADVGHSNVGCRPCMWLKIGG